MKFEAIARETVLLDPNNEMARKNIPNEIRKDPLTGKTSRICHFRELKWKKPDIDKLIAGTKNWCPFCPDKGAESHPLLSTRNRARRSHDVGRQNIIPQHRPL